MTSTSSINKPLSQLPIPPIPAEADIRQQSSAQLSGSSDASSLPSTARGPETAQFKLRKNVDIQKQAKNLEEIINSITPDLNDSGLWAPHWHVPNGQNLPDFLRGHLCQSKWVDAINEALTCKPLDASGKRNEKLRGKHKDKAKKCSEEVTKIISAIEGYAAAFEKGRKNLRLSVWNNNIKDINQTLSLQCTALNNIQKSGDELGKIAEQLPTLSASEKRSTLVDDLKKAVEILISKNGEVLNPSLFRQKFVDYFRGHLANYEDLIEAGKLPEEKKKPRAELQKIVESSVPNEIVRMWSRVKTAYDALSLFEKSCVAGSEDATRELTKKEMDSVKVLIDEMPAFGVALDYLHGLHGVEDDRLVGLVRITQTQKSAEVREVEDAGLASFTAKEEECQRWPVYFANEHYYINQQGISLMNVVVNHLFDTVVDKLYDQAISREKLSKLVEKMEYVATAFGDLHVYLRNKLREKFPDIELDNNHHAGKMLAELEYRQFTVKAIALAARVTSRYFPSKPETREGVQWVSQMAREADDNQDIPVPPDNVDELGDLVESLKITEEKTGTVHVAKIANEPLTEPPLIVASSPAAAASTSQIYTTEKSAEVRGLVVKANESKQRSHQNIGQYNSNQALIPYREIAYMKEAVADFTEAAKHIDKAIKIMEETEKQFLGGKDILELNKMRKNIYRKAEFYQAFLDSPLSKPLSKEDAKALFEAKKLTVTGPNDDDFFQNAESRKKRGKKSLKPNDCMFEAVLQPDNFELNGMSQKVKPTYLHVHVNDEDALTKLKSGDLQPQDLPFTHMKSKFYRFHGSDYDKKNVGKDKVDRELIEQKFALDLLKTTAQSVPV